MALTSDSRQAANPDLSHPPPQHQPEQTAQTTREKRRQDNRMYSLRYRDERLAYFHHHRSQRAAKRRGRYKQNPTPALVATAKWIARNRERRRRQQQAWYQQKLARLRAQGLAAYT